MQETTVIQNVYIGQTHSQIQEHEEQKKRPKKKGTFGDGMAKLVTSNEFMGGVKEYNKEAERQQNAKTVREEVTQLYKEAMTKWTEQEKQCLKWNKKKQAKHKEQVAAWEKEQDMAKAEKRRPRWAKPKIAEFGLESIADRPKKKDFELDGYGRHGGPTNTASSGSDDNETEVGSEQELDQEADSDL
ncbi:hypothetical protein EDD18DRAFT_1087586 [Armillaria luteobubalina]|uniref:Uncharacterized protein n=1 Tax=Armillaria luteobubalina TaxID=153913 RepID=A0AA39P5K2_9AGAR|nr:hypothetical protein EDD18DRAFT_1087586 [Armillaria luteobubalina]